MLEVHLERLEVVFLEATGEGILSVPQVGGRQGQGTCFSFPALQALSETDTQ